MTTVKRKVPSREAFTQSMAAWMVNKGMVMGTTPEDIDLFGSVQLAKIAAKIFLTIGSITPFFISGGAKADKVKQVLDPFLKLSNLVGVKIPQGVLETEQYLLLVLYADELTPKEIIERFDIFTQFAPSVAKLGLRVNFQSQTMIVFPVLVYFDSQCYAQHAQEIRKTGWRRNFIKNVYLRACTIDLPNRKIELAEMTRFTENAAKLWEKFGLKNMWESFRPSDLELVLLLSEKLDAAKKE